MTHTQTPATSRTAPYRTTTDPNAVLTRAWPHLCAIARRIVDDATQADDVVRDTWQRWRRDRVTREHPVRTDRAARLAVSVIASARRRPDPGERVPPAVRGTDAERADAAELAVMLLRDHLSSAELAAYLLRKIVDCPSRPVTAIARLAATASGLGVVGTRRGPAGWSGLRRAVLAASRSGNFADLDDLLAADLADHPTRWPTGRKR